MSDFHNNINTFYESVEMPGGWRHDHVETIKTIDLYYNSKYKTSQYDRQNFRKFFYNIVKPACDIATKFIDLDTRDVVLVPSKDGDEIKVWAMQRRLKQWMKDKKFGQLLNEIAFDLPKYGHVVVKKSKDGWKKINIHNIRTDPSVSSLEKSSFVYEPHFFSKRELLEFKWDTEELFKRSKGPMYLVYECYDMVDDEWQRTIKADVMRKVQPGGGTIETAESMINQEDEFLPPIILDGPKKAPLPYRELKWEEIPGRWLGFGFVEYLEDNQIATNEAENLERKGLMYKALNLWQTRDDAVGGSNVLTGSENGDILRVDAEITPLQKDNSDLSAYNNTRANWSNNTERKTFTTDITTGANLPSRTPLGVANLQASLATSYFELKRENYGLFLKDLIQKDIIPDFQRDSTREHTLTFLGGDDDLDKLDTMVARVLVDNATEKYANETGFFPSELQKADLEDRALRSLKSKKNRFLKIPDNFYTDANFVVDVLVTGEQIDVGTKSSVLQLVLQLIGTNPGLLQNKTTRSMIFSLLSMGGISPVEINALQEDVDTTPVPQGGSVSPVTPFPQSPTPTNPVV